MKGCFVLYPFEVPFFGNVKRKVISGLDECFGLELAEDVYSDEDIPPYDVAIRDGWAICTSDENHLLKQEAVTNGCLPKYLSKNSTCWINTGGFLPQRANAVIAETDPNSPQFGRNSYPLENVLPKGSEWNRGDIVLKAGTLLGASEQALLFEAGIERVPVYRRPTVAILSTGHEIIETGKGVGQGRHSSNATYLSNLLSSLGLTDIEICFSKDSAQSIASNIQTLEKDFDFIVTIGGTGKGRSDVLREALTLCAAEIYEGKKQLSSSLPFVYAKINNSVLIGLPGNPLGFICLAQRLVLTQIWNFFMSTPFPFKKQRAVMGFDYKGKAGDICVQLARFEKSLIVLPLQKGSGRSSAFRDAKAVICNPLGLQIPADTQVEVEMFFDGHIS